MSLLSESVNTVTQLGSWEGASINLGPQNTVIPNGIVYKTYVASCEPKTVNKTYLLLDVVTGLPLNLQGEVLTTVTFFTDVANPLTCTSTTRFILAGIPAIGSTNNFVYGPKSIQEDIVKINVVPLIGFNSGGTSSGCGNNEYPIPVIKTDIVVGVPTPITGTLFVKIQTYLL